MTLVLTRSEAAGLLELEPLAEDIGAAFVEHATGRGLPVVRQHLGGRGGAFHVVAGGVDLGAPVFTVKTNAHFARPAGFTAAFAADTGELLALLDSAYLTVMRTAAMTVVALGALGHRGAQRGLVVGAGRQGRAQAEAMRFAVPGLRRLEVYDVRPEAAAALASDVNAAVARDLGAAAREADVLVTTTPSREAFLDAGMVAPGATVLAYGADGPGKRELHLDLMTKARIVTDLRRQAVESGELQHVAGAGHEDLVRDAAEIGDVLAGTAAGRPADDAVVVYDATGTALQDAVAAWRLITAAQAAGRGSHIDLAT